MQNQALYIFLTNQIILKSVAPNHEASFMTLVLLYFILIHNVHFIAKITVWRYVIFPLFEEGVLIFHNSSITFLKDNGYNLFVFHHSDIYNAQVRYSKVKSITACYLFSKTNLAIYKLIWPMVQQRINRGFVFIYFDAQNPSAPI